MNWPVDAERIAKGLYWQEAWQLVEGCTHVSAGCDHCWSAAETRVRAGQKNPKISGPKEGLVIDGRFNGAIRLREDNLDKPLRRKKPTVYAIWNDLFHEDVPDEFIDEAFAVMALAPQHTFLVLTKRPQRMYEYMTKADWSEKANGIYDRYIKRLESQLYHYGEIVPPLPNLILGTSVENQKTADERIPLLLQTPAAKRFVSYEPAIGGVDFTKIKLAGKNHLDVLRGWEYDTASKVRTGKKYSDSKLDWIIMGGESGPRARPMHPDWARSVRDQCAEAGVPFFFKQWGEWAPTIKAKYLNVETRKLELHETAIKEGYPDKTIHLDKRRIPVKDGMLRVGKSRAGCLIDGKEYKETP